MTASNLTAPAPLRSRRPARRAGTSRAADSPRRRLQPFVVFSLAVVAAFFAVIFIRVSLDSTAFQLDELETRIAAEEARHWELRLEIARLQAPDRIQAAATSMGMVFPEERSVLEVAGVGEYEGADPESRWGELKSLLSAQP